MRDLRRDVYNRSIYTYIHLYTTNTSGANELWTKKESMTWAALPSTLPPHSTDCPSYGSLNLCRDFAPSGPLEPIGVQSMCGLCAEACASYVRAQPKVSGIMGGRPHPLSDGT